jgi:hypothetical protein
VVNVSVSGLLIRVAEPYDLETFVEIEMSPAVGVFIRAIVQIVRLHAQAPGWIQYGVRIESQEDEDQRLLKETLLAIRRDEMDADFGRSPVRRRSEQG